jgi:hypothetical protein
MNEKDTKKLAQDVLRNNPLSHWKVSDKVKVSGKVVPDDSELTFRSRYEED